jgi:NADPH:quinone reductase-like Zn-dependent oxidoreductase
MLADTKKAIILKKPETISFEDSASLPIVALTAYTGLVIQGRIDQSPKNVIIAGASGGVGAIAVQIAKRLNCQVTAVCSGANADFVKGLGADTVVDYTKGTLDELFIFRHIYDVMLDCVGGNDYWELAQKILKPDGIFTTATGPVVDVPVSASAIFSIVSSTAWRKIAYSQSYNIIMNPSKMPDELINWIKDGSFKSIITQKFKLEEMEKAHDLSRSHRTRGKAILIISDDDLINF